MLDLNSLENRKYLVDFFTEDNDQEKERLAQSKFECDIYEGHIEKHVLAYLKKQYDESTIKEMSPVDMINMAKRVANQEGSIYKESPEREFEGKADESNLENWYDLTRFKSKALKSNRYFKLQNQNLIYIPIVNGAPEIRVIKKHQAHVYMDEGSPVYLFPNYAQVKSMQGGQWKNDARFTVWSENFNFVMNGHGEVIGENDDLSNPLSVVPVIDVAYELEQDYWTTEKVGLSEFTRLLNASIMDVLFIMKMQGFAVGTLKGSPEVLKLIETQTIGPTKFVKIPTVTDKDGNKVDGDLEYKSPAPDLMGSLEILRSVIYLFLSSRGIDPKTVNMGGEGQSFTSGWERLLSLIEKFEASLEDIDLYKGVEASYLEIIKAYNEAYISSDNLAPEFKVSEYASLELSSVNYKRPEMIETRKEKGERLKAEVDNKFKSRLSAFMELHEIEDEEAALERLKKMKEQESQWEAIFGNTTTEESNNNGPQVSSEDAF